MNFLYVCLWARNKRTEISPIILGSSETVSFRYCSHPFSRLLLLLYDTLFFFWGVGSSEIQENREKVNNWGVFPLRLWMLGDLFLLLQPELEGFSMSVCGWISCQLPGLDLHRVQVVYQWVGNDTLTPVLIILWIPVLFLNLLSTIYFWEPSNSSPCFLSRFYSSIQWERWWSTLTPRYIEPGHFTLLTIYFFYSSKNYSC